MVDMAATVAGMDINADILAMAMNHTVGMLGLKLGLMPVEVALNEDMPVLSMALAA